MLDELRRFKRSLKHALDGISYAFRHEKNFRIELLVGFFVLLFIVYFKIKSWEVVILLLLIMWVLILELLNTVLERVVDILKPRIHPYARLIKDLMASVVLISALVSLIIGLIIFSPYVWQVVSMFSVY